MIAVCAPGNENCFDMEIRLLYCYKGIVSHGLEYCRESKKKEKRVFFFSRMAMNDLMRARESEHARQHLATGHGGRFRAFFFFLCGIEGCRSKE